MQSFSICVSWFPLYNLCIMTTYDLCLAWNWEYDRDFVRLLAAACEKGGLAFLTVTAENLDSTLAGLASKEISVAVFFDRASESDPRFQPLVDMMCKSPVFRINPQELTIWSADKATMHMEFANRGVDTPYTILLTPCHEQPGLPPLDLSPLGGRFAIKPASMGGGEGVVLEATSFEQVLSVRWQYPHEKYLLQAQVAPQVLDGRPAWFRILACNGAVYPCWWDQITHIYSPVRAEERFRYGLRSLYEVVRRIAQVCRLDLFSTEIALEADGRFLAVDYVNDPVDLRMQSKAADGVPDIFVENIAGRLARLTAHHCSLQTKL
jgi:hypothetical protein